MRVRKLGRWAVRVVAIAAFGLGATVGTMAVVSADEEPTPAPESSTTVEEGPEQPDVMAPNSASWD